MNCGMTLQLPSQQASFDRMTSCALQRVVALLREREHELHMLAKALLEKETLTQVGGGWGRWGLFYSIAINRGAWKLHQPLCLSNH